MTSSPTVEPASRVEAEGELADAAVQILDIEAQIAEREAEEREYLTWRARAYAALKRHQARQMFLKRWLYQHPGDGSRSASHRSTFALLAAVVDVLDSDDADKLQTLLEWRDAFRNRTTDRNGDSHAGTD